MILILTKSFLQKEYKLIKKYYSLEDIKKAVNKLRGQKVRLSNLGYTGGELFKLRMVHKVAGRLIVFMYKQKNLVIPIVIRLKKDKVFGENLSMNNKKAKILILNSLDSAIEDIDQGNFEKTQF